MRRFAKSTPALEKQGIQMEIGTPEALQKLTVRDLQRWEQFIAADRARSSNKTK